MAKWREPEVSKLRAEVERLGRECDEARREIEQLRQLATVRRERMLDRIAMHALGVHAEDIHEDDGDEMLSWRQVREALAADAPAGLCVCDLPVGAPCPAHPDTPAAVDRPGEVWDTSVPPGGYVCATCGVPTESEPCPDHTPAASEPEVKP